jgi:hypothetical protein
MIVSSEILPRRAPTRPAVSTGGGKSEACDLSSWSAFSSAFFPSSGASANSSRSFLIFSSTGWCCSGPVGAEDLSAVAVAILNVLSSLACGGL